MDEEWESSLLEWHRSDHSQIAWETLFDLRRAILAKGMRIIPKVFIDTNHWIGMRDRYVGGGVSQYQELYAVLSKAVRENKVICVLHQSVFSEICKQSPASLKQSAQLIEELTQGICLRPRTELNRVEAFNFLSKHGSSEGSESDDIWTKVGLILESDFASAIADPRIRGNEAVMKCALDRFWLSEFGELLEKFEWDTKPKFGYAITDETLENVVKLWRDRRRRGVDLDAIRAHEFRFIVSEFYGDYIRGIFKAEGHILSSDDLSRFLTGVAVALEKGQLERGLPGGQIHAELYCARERATRPLTSNDWFDFQIAAVAVPYCDFFLTEKHLRHQLCDELKLATCYECSVFSSVTDFVSALAPHLDADRASSQ